MIDAVEIIDSLMEVKVNEAERKRIFGQMHRFNTLCTVSILCALGIFYYIITGRNRGICLLLLLAAYAILAGAIFYKKKILAYWMNILFEECDPVRFMDVTYAWALANHSSKTTWKKRKESGSVTYLYYYANALRYQDEANWELAGQMMESLIGREPGVRSQIFVAQFMEAYCSYQMDQEGLEKYVKRLEFLCQKQSKKFRKAWLADIENDRKLLLLRKAGDTQGCYDFYESCLASAQNQLRKVILRYRAGVTGLDLGKEEEAAAHLRYASAHGGGLFVAKKAEELLDSRGLSQDRE